MSELSRRTFLAIPPVALAAAAFGQPSTGQSPVRNITSTEGDAHRGAVTIASLNGLRATQRAWELMQEGYDPADCIVQGVRIIEDDPEDTSVGYGGLPNEDGIVELDASVMYGPTHKAGSVASLRNIKNPAMVALDVLRRTDHCLIVGDGALRFAKQMGYAEENLLTERARQEWQKWRENMSLEDDRLNDSERDELQGKSWDEKRVLGITDYSKGPVQHLTGTVHCSIVDAKANIASCTSTSGLSWKIPGRVGDSPIIGAGNYCDNNIGAAGSTGRGEANLANLSAFYIVMLMEQGKTPSEACLLAAKRLADHTKEKRLRGPDGKVNFDIKFYALRKDGAYGAASMYRGAKLAVCHEGGAHTVDALSVYDTPAPQ